MRRKDREVTDSQKIREIILSCRCCRLGFYDNGEVYIVPLDFGYYENNGSIYYYNRKISDYTDNDRIKTYRGFFRNGYSNETYDKSLTDCGDFTTQIVEDYLILGNKLYKNGELVIKK